MKFTQTEADEKECLGVVFDVDTARNDTSRLFSGTKVAFRECLPYGRTCDDNFGTPQIYAEKLQKRRFYFGTSNERLENRCMTSILAVLIWRKFPRLFKRAIPFKMNIKLEDFVKEYICMEQDIHIEDMQESVMQYGRMRQRIEDTLKEAKSLEEIKESFVKFKTKKEEQDYCQYRMNKLDVLKLKTDIHLLQQKIEDGEKDLVEEAKAEHPFQFISGLGTTLEAFESQIAPLNKGDKFDFTISSQDAYGEYNEEHVLDLPKHIFEIDGKFDNERIFAGNVVPLMDSEGRRMNGTVVEVKPDVVVVDMNHPLAGADLTFVGEVIESRPATNEEIQEIVNMMGGGGCSCGCGDCGSDCGDHECGEGCGCH